MAGKLTNFGGKKYLLHAPKLIENGFDVTPVNGKRPIIKGWESRPDEALDFKKYANFNIGILTGGEKNLIAVDIDVYNRNVVEEIKKILSITFGEAPSRIGEAPKVLFPYICSQRVKKQRTATFEINGRSAAVEILGDCQQCVASGIHPDTHKIYKWDGDNLIDYKIEELTVVTQEQISEFISEVNELLLKYGTRKASPKTNGNGKIIDWFADRELEAKTTEIEHALAAIDNDDWHYEDWQRLGHAVKSAVGKDEHEGKRLFHAWSGKSKKYCEQETEKLWNSIKEVKNIGAGTLFFLAEEYGFSISDYRQEKKTQDEENLEKIEINELTGLPENSYTAQSVRGPVKKREWVLEEWFPKKTVSLLFGQGGVGKTLVIQQLANCIAKGEDFFNVKTQKMPVLCVFCEDDNEEINRRQMSINEWMGVEEGFSSASEQVFFWPRVGEDNIVVTFPSQGEDKATNFYHKLLKVVEKIKGEEKEICVILDNATDFFGGSENVRREVNSFIKTYCGALCTRYNATVILLAHPSLSGLASGSGMSGSTAWENSVRSRSYLARDEEVDDLRVLSRKKSNYSAIDSQNDIKLIWENGVLTKPNSSEALEKMEMRGIKRDVLNAVDQADKQNAPFKARSGRVAKRALPKILPQHKAKFVVKAFLDLENDGYIVHTTRKGYTVENWPEWSKNRY